MRDEKVMISLILSVANADERIRAVILNGSRTNKNVIKDEFQDFDIIFLVENILSFQGDLNWIDVFGERIIMQMPNSIQLEELVGLQTNTEDIVYLMLFKDRNRIDLTLIDVRHQDKCKDSLNKILLDKDQLFNKALKPSDKDYWIKKPTPKEFADCCNEFWWVATYIVKGLEEMSLYMPKEMLEGPVRCMFMRMLAWYVGSEINFSINLGNSNRFLKNTCILKCGQKY